MCNNYTAGLPAYTLLTLNPIILYHLSVHSLTLIHTLISLVLSMRTINRVLGYNNIRLDARNSTHGSLGLGLGLGCNILDSML